MIPSMTFWEPYLITLIMYKYLFSSQRHYRGVLVLACDQQELKYMPSLFQGLFFLKVLHTLYFLIRKVYLCFPTITERHSRTRHLLGLTWAKLMSNVFNVWTIILKNGHMSQSLNDIEWIIHHHIGGSSASHKGSIHLLIELFWLEKLKGLHSLWIFP